MRLFAFATLLIIAGPACEKPDRPPPAQPVVTTPIPHAPAAPPSQPKPVPRDDAGLITQLVANDRCVFVRGGKLAKGTASATLKSDATDANLRLLAEVAAVVITSPTLEKAGFRAKILPPTELEANRCETSALHNALEDLRLWQTQPKAKTLIGDLPASEQGAIQTGLAKLRPRTGRVLEIVWAGK